MDEIAALETDAQQHAAEARKYLSFVNILTFIFHSLLIIYFIPAPCLFFTAHGLSAG